MSNTPSNINLSSVEKVYFFLRAFINGDRYGRLNNYPDRLKKVGDNILRSYKKGHDVETIIKNLEHPLFENIKQEVSYYEKFKNLIKFFENIISNREDCFYLGITASNICPQLNYAIGNIPDKKATQIAIKSAEQDLTQRGDQALSDLIKIWDCQTEDYCLRKEREEAINLQNKLMSFFKNTSEIKKKDEVVISTAVLQEFERRAGQKRKGRAGKDLESAAECILKFLKIPSSGGPEHFSAEIEIDNWFLDENRWYIGVSLKRTYRERWKQTTIDIETLTRHRIKNIIHFVNNDSDFSLNKITSMGSQRHLFFLPDESEFLKKFKDHTVCGKYLFKMTQVRKQLNKLRGKN
jgi:hypothetical protein